MSFSLTWLPSVLRGAGLRVVEQPGWRDRGQGDIGKIQLVICHHTAEKVDADLHPDLEILTEGREGLRGCLAQLGLGQDGTYYVIAAGKAWHAGAGSWKGITEGNSHAIGIEAENNGLGEPWPEIQMDAYARGCAAIAKFCGFGADMVIAHREWAPKRKIDPSFSISMDEFRKRVAGFIAAPVPAPKPVPAKKPIQLAENGIPRRSRIDLSTPAELAIREAMRQVEMAGASIALTDSVVLLGKALDRMADHVEGIA